MPRISADVGSTRPADFEKEIRILEFTLCKHPPIPASPKLPLIAPSVLNFNFPYLGGDQLIFNFTTDELLTNLKLRGHEIKLIIGGPDSGWLPLHHYAKRLK
ncbi:hypothetical protein V6N12_046078 [Hibiscus sabdariffa]|uniref:Uncharacterized protein n=1 Tax=Hibiscus sabdariffa TaxID=183260 RepID=A0ABR2G4K0_9ROSI